MSNIKITNDEKLKVNKKRRNSKGINRSIKKVINSEDLSDNFQRFELERCSTPNLINICEHCNHQHAKECCMYVYDKHDDIIKYSNFKQSVESNYYTAESEEDFDMKIGSSTPIGFPAFTENNPEVANKKVINFQPPPVVYLRQYFWPIFMPSFLQPYNPTYYLDQAVKYQPPVYHGNYMTSYMPCVMRQVPIPVQQNNFPMKHPQVIESHNYFPVNYLGSAAGNWL